MAENMAPAPKRNKWMWVIIAVLAVVLIAMPQILGQGGNSNVPTLDAYKTDIVKTTGIYLNANDGEIRVNGGVSYFNDGTDETYRVITAGYVKDYVKSGDVWSVTKYTEDLETFDNLFIREYGAAVDEYFDKEKYNVANGKNVRTYTEKEDSFPDKVVVIKITANGLTLTIDEAEIIKIKLSGYTVSIPQAAIDEDPDFVDPEEEEPIVP